MDWLQKNKRIWQGGVFVVLLIVVFFVFRDGKIDIWCTQLFYDSQLEELWIFKNALWVAIAYKGGSLFTVTCAIAIISVSIASLFLSKLVKFRPLCLFAFLVLALGPGLTVNAILKDNWGRPRPRDIVEFSGDKDYQSPFVMSDQGGKSFPCGHCSVGFAICLMGFWSKRMRGLSGAAWAWWAAAGLTGVYVGFARIAVGGHFLSDVLVSGILVWAIAWGLDSFLPQKTTTGLGVKFRPEKKRGGSKLLITMAGVASVGLLLGVLAAMPIDRSEIWKQEIPGEFAEQYDSMKIVANDGIVWIGADQVPLKSLIRDGQTVLEIQQKLSGFGFPWSRIELIGSLEPEDDRTLVMSIGMKKSGFFTEMKLEIQRYVEK